MGTPDFSVPTLEAVLAANHDVCLVVTQPDRPKGRGKEVMETPVKQVALRHHIPVFQPLTMKEKATIETLKQYKADTIIVIAFGQILPKSVLELTPYGCINVHASLLPAYRGAAPIQWAVINGEKETGVTTMQMDAGIDTGAMILKETIPIAADETGASLHDKLALVGAKLCVTTLAAIEDGTATFEKQGESTTGYAKMFKKSMGAIDWNLSALEIERLIRGLNAWPGAYTKLENKEWKIWKAKVLEETGRESEPGTISILGKSRLVVQCGQGRLEILMLQLPGKKRMATDAFLRGYTLQQLQFT